MFKVSSASRRGRAHGMTTLGVTALLAASLVAPSSTTRARSGDPAGRSVGAVRQAVPENFHARLDAADVLAKTGESLARTEVSAAERGAEAALAARVPQLHVTRDELSQYPVMVLSYEPGTSLATPSKAAAKSPELAAREFLSSNKSLYGLATEDLTSLRMRYTTSPEGGATIVKFDQYVGGLPVFGEEFAVAMTKTNEVVATSGRLFPNVEAGASTHGKLTLPAGDAIVRALADLTNRQTAIGDYEIVNPNAEGGYKVYAFTPDRTAGAQTFLSEDIRVREVAYPMAAGRFIAAYYLELWVRGEPTGSGPVFSYVISAEDGTLLFRNNLSQNDAFNYRVYADGTGDKRPWDGPTGTIGTPHPTGTPDGYQAPFILAPMVSVESLLTPSDPWLAPGATVTTGNNTDAYLDLGGADGFTAGDIRGAVTAPGVFDYQYDSTQNYTVAVNRQAAVVGMFYQVNWLHDVWYQHGFTEVAGNAQMLNFGRGGAENDSLKAEGQDQSGTDNANMNTPADGGRPRMQMYGFNASGSLNPTRDGTFDMLIVGHEMGHYISNRLIGNASGLNNKQGGSMGEGWGDFNCVLTTVQDTDNVEGTAFAIGGQTDIFALGPSFVNNYYYSIRRYPMSSSKLKNPWTFKDIGPGIGTYPGVPFSPAFGGAPSEVHNSGEIWAEMQWEAFVGLARAYGVATARQKALQYMIDGMKLTPSSPTFTQARDGWIAAANAANSFANPKDVQILWQAFAKRGIGIGAISPLSNSNNHAGITESFTAASALPDDTIGVYAGGNFFERDVLFGGNADQTVSFGAGGLTPLVGNWDGAAGPGLLADTPGLYDTATGSFFLRNSNTPGAADFAFQYGPGGAGAIPVVGDWNGDGATSIGIYVPSTGAFFLRNSNSAGAADIVFNFGPTPSTLIPIAGDWNNDGTDSIGLYDPATGTFFLKNSNSPGAADIVFSFGAGGAIPLTGDWNSDGFDSVGLYVPATGIFFLKNATTNGPADETIGFGPGGAALPVAGNFDGQ